MKIHQLKSLERISPSNYTSLKKCPYRVVLANTLRRPLLPYSPASHLGNVIHECISLILSGKITTLDAFSKKWDELVLEEEAKLKKMGFDFFVPLSINISGYSIKKLQVRSLINKGGVDSVDRSQNSKLLFYNEKWLQSKDELIGGRPDLISISNEFTKLSDFKSGKILNEDGQIKEVFEEQVKLYAYLYFENYGKFPDSLSLIDLSRKEYFVDFNSDECISLATEAKALMSKVNDIVREDNRENLANPSLESCSNCLYRPVCSFHWSLCKISQHNPFTDIRGNLKSLKQYGNGNISAFIESNGSIKVISHLRPSERGMLESLMNRKIAFYNVLESEPNERFKALKTTTVYEV